MSTARTSRPASKSLEGFQRLGCFFSAQRISTGAMMTTPTASPSHQVIQIAPALAQGAKPARTSVPTPMVALTRVLTRAASTKKVITSCARANARRPEAKRVTRYVPSTASRVLPTAIPSDVETDPAVVTLARNAPTKIAGHIRVPRMRRAASAMPAAGQTGVALAWTNARRGPGVAARGEVAPVRTRGDRSDEEEGD